MEIIIHECKRWTRKHMLGLCLTLLRGCLHHGPWSCPMLEGIFIHGHTSMVWFLKKCILKAFGLLNMCKTKSGPREGPCAKKWMCWLFFEYMSKMGSFGIFFMLDLLPFFFPSFLVTMQTFGKNTQKNKRSKEWLKQYFSTMVPDICSERTSFASLTAKLVEPWQWIM